MGGVGPVPITNQGYAVLQPPDKNLLLSINNSVGNTTSIGPLSLPVDLSAYVSYLLRFNGMVANGLDDLVIYPFEGPSDGIAQWQITSSNYGDTTPTIASNDNDTQAHFFDRSASCGQMIVTFPSFSVLQFCCVGADGTVGQGRSSSGMVFLTAPVTEIEINTESGGFLNVTVNSLAWYGLNL